MKKNFQQSQTNVKEETWGEDGVIGSQQEQNRADEKERRRRGELYKGEAKELSRADGLREKEEEEDFVEGIYSEPTIMPQPKEAQQTPLTRHSTARWIFCPLMLPRSRSPLDHFLSRSSLKRSDSYKAARPILSPEVVRRSVESSTVSSAVTSPDTSVI